MVPKGNQELLKQGGIVLSGLPEIGHLRDLLDHSIVASPKTAMATPLEFSLLSNPANEPVPLLYASKKTWACESMRVSEAHATEQSHIPQSSQSLSVYDAVKPIILDALQTPLSVDKLAKILGVRKAQLQDWLAPLLKEGILSEKLKGKTKIIALMNQNDELKLG
jgi:hypothetical protein